MLTLFCWPKGGEVLSSWLYRNAVVNHLQYSHFLKHILETRVSWNTDIDNKISLEMIHKLVRKTPLNFCDIYKITFASDRVVYSKTPWINPENYLIFPISKYHQNELISGFQYCPRCKLPYFKKVDRYIFSIICIICTSYLVNKCTSCSSPIRFVANHKQSKHINSSIMMCYSCGKDIIRKAYPIRYATTREYKTQLLINKYFLNFRGSNGHLFKQLLILVPGSNYYKKYIYLSSTTSICRMAIFNNLFFSNS